MIRRACLTILAAAAIAACPLPSGSAAPFASTPALKVVGYELLADGSPVRGICVWWHLDRVTTADEKRIRGEMGRIKRLGFIGIGIEAGWNALCAAPGQFKPDAAGTDLVIRWAKQEGLWVHLLLTPHYMPDWVKTKYGDIRMRDESGNPADGSFMPFSPYSPAVADLRSFQKQAVAHFSRHPNLLAIWLTNEQGFGAKWLDYSKWGEAAWRKWLQSANPSLSFWNERWETSFGSFAQVTPPKPGGDSRQWHDWLRFRRLSLRDYFNSLYDNAAAARKRFVPIGHKTAIYNSLDAFARQWALQPSVSWKMDVAGFDAYGSDSAMLALARSLGKPVIMAETNFTRTPDGPPGRTSMLSMLLRQQLSGCFIQTLYAWNDYDEANFLWGLKNKGGELRGATWGASDAARFIRSHQMSAGQLPAKVALVVPAQAFAARSDDYASFQHRISAVADYIYGRGIDMHVLFSDDISPGSYIGGTGAPRASLKNYSAIIALNDFGLDGEFFESGELKKWVQEGGVLLVPKRDSGPPAWTGMAASTVTGTQFISSAGGEGEWAVSHRVVTSPTTLRLTGGTAVEVAVLATLESTGEPVALRRRVGQGQVVYMGIDVLGKEMFGTDARLVSDVVSQAKVLPRVNPAGPSLYQLPSAALLVSDSNWEGEAQLNASIKSMVVYHNKGGVVPNPPIRKQDATTLAGFLPGGWFALVGTK